MGVLSLNKELGRPTILKSLNLADFKIK